MSAFTPLRALAPAKINLGLFVGQIRAEDGRHELVSVMQSISLADELVLEPVGEAGGDQLICPGVEGPPEHNLAMRALAAFRELSGWDAGPVRLTVRKRVPVAAGLGGGSGDAAAALRLASAASGFDRQETLIDLAAALGADVPAQVQPGRWLASGAGERLQALANPKSSFGMLVLPHSKPLSTAAVYRELDGHGTLRSAADLERCAKALGQALASGQPLPPEALMENDLEAPALSLCPSIAASLAHARNAGAQIAMLSGSGPTVLGLYDGARGPAMAEQAARRLTAAGVPAWAATPVEAAYGAARKLAPDQAHDLPLRNN